MKTVGIFYGSDTGNTKKIAQLIHQLLGDNLADLWDLSDKNIPSMGDYNKLILGQPTWYGGELQSCWEKFWPNFKKIDFHGKQVALFGLGDQLDYGEFFVDAMGLMHNIAIQNGADPVGYTSTKGYHFIESKALCAQGEFFVGLAIDEHHQLHLTQQRVKKWVEQIHGEMDLSSINI